MKEYKRADRQNGEELPIPPKPGMLRQPPPPRAGAFARRPGYFYTNGNGNVTIRPSRLQRGQKEKAMIKKGSKVKFDYTLTVDGKVQDTSAGRGPLEYTHGAGQIIQGLEEVLEQMNLGDKKTVEIKAEKAYGPVLQEAIKRVPKEAIMNADQLKVGDMVGASNEGHTFRAVVTEITDKEITLDFNHPLAGKDLTFEVEIKEINE